MTRVAAAKAGTITEEFRDAAKREHMDPEKFTAAIASGSIVLLRNMQRKIQPLAIGAHTRIKVNANIGTSSSRFDINEELEKP